MEFVKLKTVDDKLKESFCGGMAKGSQETMAIVERCHPEALKKAKAMCSGDGKGDGKDDKGDGKGDDKPMNPICVAAGEGMKPFKGLTKEQAMKMPNLASLCAPMKLLSASVMEIVKGCYPDMMQLAMAVCKGDGKGDGKGDKSGAGGLRIRSPHATIELGGDVKLFRAGAKALTVDAAVNVKGSVSAKSVKIGGVPLDDYIRKMVKELLEKEK